MNPLSHQRLHRFAMEQKIPREEVLEWCECYIANYWRPIQTQWLHILIQDPKDAMFFKLTWNGRYKRHLEPEP